MKFIKGIIIVLKFLLLTVISQTGGILYLINQVIFLKFKKANRLEKTISFLALYLIITFLFTPPIARLNNREPVLQSKNIQSANVFSKILNRNYVSTELNLFLAELDKSLDRSNIKINLLDANFPFLDGFPLLPHLSHNDGKKLDISLVYENSQGAFSEKIKSNLGYGVFEEPTNREVNQANKCKKLGYFQYSYPKHLTFGKVNSELLFSQKGTKKLIKSILNIPELEKLFIEPHLKNRLNLHHDKIRFHGCRAVRHDDHIHIQIK